MFLCVMGYVLRELFSRGEVIWTTKNKHPENIKSQI